MKCLTVRIVDHSRVERDRSALVLAAADVTVVIFRRKRGHGKLG
jgi:hypothetical protein